MGSPKRHGNIWKGVINFASPTAFPVLFPLTQLTLHQCCKAPFFYCFPSLWLGTRAPQVCSGSNLWNLWIYYIWEKQLLNVIKFTDLKIGRLSWMSWVGSVSSNHMSPLKHNFLWLESERCPRRRKEIQNAKGYGKRSARSSRRQGRLPAASQGGNRTPGLQPRGTEFCRQSQGAGKQIPPWSLQERRGPEETQVLSLWETDTENPWSHAELGFWPAETRR